MKVCTKCKEEKLEDDFHKAAKGRGGLHARCKICRNAESRGFHQVNKDRINQVSREWHSTNKESVTRRKAAWKASDPEGYKECNQKSYLNNKGKQRQYSLKKLYGISLKDYDNLLESQGGVCAICRYSAEERGSYGVLCVDHNHITGEVRGLLCSNCNTGIGLLMDNAEIVINAAKYLGEQDV